MRTSTSSKIEYKCPKCSRSVDAESLNRMDVNVVNERREERCPATLKVEYNSFGEFISQYTINVSKGGMFIRTASPLSIGTRLDLLIYIPGLEEPLRVKGRVAHREAFGAAPDEIGVGVQFIEMDSKSKKALISFIDDIRG